ncbi:omega-amidase NIT2-like [Drosophila eugracilis]|uniref:omega-amidase NIT2-like n=1 Tax=Drosophila eugracilis TaxID=29029 RepID=UPI001BDB4426|nr:omega-amidase NIT2-like [Drosophila eugracilis]
MKRSSNSKCSSGFFNYINIPDSVVMRLAILQLWSFKDKIANVQNIANKIEMVVKEHNPRLITLPEYFVLPKRKNIECVPDGYISQQLSGLAKKHQVYIIGGTIPELGENDAMYNTCTVWSPTGDLMAKYRKVHLFDVEVKGGISFNESDDISAGNDLSIINVDGHKIGIGICYDIRFEEMARVYRNAGCEMIIYPSAFNMTTGPLHWELLQRARANDNQLFIVTASTARDTSAKYVAYGHSMVVDPWAKVLHRASEREETVVADIDFNLVEQVRQQIPVFDQRRLDIYATEKK